MRYLLCLGLVAGMTLLALASTLDQAPLPLIAEFHYDNTGPDQHEFVEIMGAAGTSLKDWRLVLYKGEDGKFYLNIPLEGRILDDEGGFGVLRIDVPSGLRNGVPAGHGIALIDDESEVVDFISYEGEVIATEGPAEGRTSTDTGQREDEETAMGGSIQRMYENSPFEGESEWHFSVVASPGVLNQSLLDWEPERLMQQSVQRAETTKLWILVGVSVAAAALFISLVLVIVFRTIRTKRLAARVEEAEDLAFLARPEEFGAQLAQMKDVTEEIPQGASRAGRAFEQTASMLQTARLLNLYTKQIERYQQQTRTQASWSFSAALLSMLAGLGFLVWGGSVLLGATESITLAAGGIISAAGGGVSAYIARTFLAIHRIAISQLNRYFRQPVISDRILCAQRLADELEDSGARETAYGKIIDSITQLIQDEQTLDGDPG